MGIHHSEEFKQQLVDLHLKGGRTLQQVADSYGLHRTTVRSWVRKAKKNFGLLNTPLSEQEAEIIELKRKLQQVELENEILKQAALILGRK